jgi:hypothetical protein
MLLISLAGCLAVDNYLSNFYDKDSTESTEYQNAVSETDDSSTTESRFFIDVRPGSTNNESETDESRSDLQLDDNFDSLVEACLISGINKYSLQIDLTECLVNYTVTENQIDNLVERLVEILEKIFMQDPLLFYLDGAMQIGYELQTAWGQRELSSLTVELQRLPEYEGLPADEIESVQIRLTQEAAAIAELTGSGRSDWEKMLIIHDELIRRISYDTSLDQAVNNTASALLNGITLCKGYAQSFKLVCDVLGLECLVISGQSEGIEHAWNLVRLDDNYYHIDVTHDDPVPDRGTNASVDHRHFLRSDAVMSETHVWNPAKYPESSLDGSHYYKQNNLTVSDIEELSQKIRQFLLISDFSDAREDNLELLFTGKNKPDSNELDQIFKQEVNNSGLNLSISYHLSEGKNVLQIIVLGN